MSFINTVSAPEQPISSAVTGSPDFVEPIYKPTADFPLYLINYKQAEHTHTRTFNNERNEFLFTTFPSAYADQPAPWPIVFPYVVDGGGYMPQLILLNSGEPSVMKLNFHGENGKPLAVVK